MTRYRCLLGGVLVIGLTTGSVAAQPPQPPETAAAPQSASQTGSSEPAILTFFRKTELLGLVDGYFHYNFNEPATGSLTPLRNFDSQHNQFSFALAELALSKPVTSDDRVGFRLDLDYGPVARTVNSFDPDTSSLVNVQQAFISFMAPVGSGLTVDFGKFVTQHGAEVIESKDNWNYSRSLLFALAIPYYHMGVRVGYAPNTVFTLGASITNGWNNITDNNSAKTYGFQGIVKPTARLAITANYMFGPEQSDNTDDWRHLLDATVSYTVNDMFGVMANYDYGRDEVLGEDVKWQGIALYGKAQVSSVFALVPRFEVYDDDDGFTTGAAQDVKEFTLTGEWKHPAGLLFRLEYRRDWSDLDAFIDDDGPTDSQNTVTAGLVYSFSSKTP